MWNEGGERQLEEIVSAVASQEQTWIQRKGAFAVDMNETTWYCELRGFSYETDARVSGIVPKGKENSFG